MRAMPYTPVRARRGNLTHACAFRAPTKTACAKPCNGYAVSSDVVDCVDCLEALVRTAKVRSQ